MICREQASFIGHNASLITQIISAQVPKFVTCGVKLFLMRVGQCSCDDFFNANSK